MNTLSYYKGEEQEIKKGEKYYLGQLLDGNGDLENLIWNGHNASSYAYIKDTIQALAKSLNIPENKIRTITETEYEENAD